MGERTTLHKTMNLKAASGLPNETRTERGTKSHIPKVFERKESANSSTHLEKRKASRSVHSSRIAEGKKAKLEKELREMKKHMGLMMNHMKAKVARNLDDLVHQFDSPFTTRIVDYPLPPKFKIPQLKNFDGLKYPFDYLESIKTVMQLQVVPDEIMCRAFPMALRGSARVWFNQLEIASIDSFIQPSRTFIDHFIGRQQRGQPPTHLLNVRQREGETLRSYIVQFNKEALQIDRPNEHVTLIAFIAGLHKGDFLFSFIKRTTGILV
uniref:Retrotransposon gag domain-containing protein n=1 Tax=Fagus sylvatica TaxID=28930 RepID=A0A2N9F6C9_FAGSY